MNDGSLYHVKLCNVVTANYGSFGRVGGGIVEVGGGHVYRERVAVAGCRSSDLGGGAGAELCGFNGKMLVSRGERCRELKRVG